MNDAALVVAGQLEEARAPCVTCSFQAEDVVVLHLLRAAAPEIPVLFLDTVHHFAQTYAYRDELAARWGLNLVNLRAAEPSPRIRVVSTLPIPIHWRIRLYTSIHATVMTTPRVARRAS